MRTTAEDSHARPLMWALLISCVMMSPVLWQSAIAYAPIAKKQDRISQELAPIPVLYTHDDPWIVGISIGESINQTPVRTVKFRSGDSDGPIVKRKKHKRSDVDEVIRRASREALLANAKADLGKRGPQLGLPSSLWCADAINAWLRKIGLPGTGSRMARSFVAHPKFERIVKPQPGDIVVIARGRGTTYGHVALYNGNCGKGAIKLRGGNQAGGRVTDQCVSGARVVGYVRPKSIPETVIARLLT